MWESGSDMGDRSVLESKKGFEPRSLLALARDAATGENRAHLASAVGQMLEADLSAQEQALASDILINLLRQAETDLRQALAERLAVLEHVPPELALALAHDEIDVARPVLLNSPVLSDLDLIYLIKTQTAQHWQTIACRPHLSAGVSQQLISTGDTATVLNLLENRGAEIGGDSMNALAVMAVRTSVIHEPLLARPEMNADLAVRLYCCASTLLREQIAARFPVKNEQVEKALDKLVEEMTDASIGMRKVTPEMAGLARSFRDRGEITADLLKGALRRRQIAFFMALFSEYLEIDPVLCEKFIQKEGGKAMAIACRAKDVPKADFATIFLLSRGARTGDKVVDQRELAIALKAFDALKVETAQDLLQRWTQSQALDIA